MVSKLSSDCSHSPSEVCTSCAEYHLEVIHKGSRYILSEGQDAVVAQWPSAALHHSAVHGWHWATGMPRRIQWETSQHLARTHGRALSLSLLMGQTEQLKSCRNKVCSQQSPLTHSKIRAQYQVYPWFLSSTLWMYFIKTPFLLPGI